jgi:hypothetical protein
LEFREHSVLLRVKSDIFETPFILHPNGDQDGAATLAEIGSRAAEASVELRGCMNCLHFRSSGMSAQFSGGFEAYCNLAGFRNQDAIVRADFGCGEHTLAPGWPNDMDTVYAARRSAALAPQRPSRVNAFKGALLGLAAGGTGPHGRLETISQALMYWRQPAKLLEVLRAGSSDKVEEGTALLIALALHKRSPEQMLVALVASNEPRSEILAGALDCFSRSPLDLSQVLVAASHGETDSASIARIAGAIAGAFNGFNSIAGAQQDSAQALELLDLAERLHETSMAVEEHRS